MMQETELWMAKNTVRNGGGTRMGPLANVRIGMDVGWAVLHWHRMGYEGIAGGLSRGEGMAWNWCGLPMAREKFGPF